MGPTRQPSSTAAQNMPSSASPLIPPQRPSLASFQDAHTLAQRHVPSSSSPSSTMSAYRAYRDTVRRSVLSTYHILGFISSGTYGRVYKARLRSPPNVDPSTANPFSSSSSCSSSSPSSPSPSSSADRASGQIYAIKKFKPDSKESEASQYTGISQSAMREIALNRELDHVNVTSLFEVRLEDKSIYMVFEYAEHDLLQLIHHHSAVLRAPIALGVLKSILWQLLNGVAYLHRNWVLHRDLKPANILVTSNGVVKIGDLGLARLYSEPLQSLYTGDKVVVTIWYRAPELLLGARHYTTAIDVWAVGCIWGELLALRPMFKGEEAKMDPKTKAAPFQTDQLKRIVEILGSPSKARWAAIETMPDYKGWWPHLRLDNYPKNLHTWYANRARSQGGYELFDALLQYDPTKRLTASEALQHPWVNEEPRPTLNAFASLRQPFTSYPTRRVVHDDLDPKMKSNAIVPITSSSNTNLHPAVGGGGSRVGSNHHSAVAYASRGASTGGVIEPPNITVTGVNSVGNTTVTSLPGSTSSSINIATATAQAAAAVAGTGTTTTTIQAKGGMVGAATANASRSKRQKIV